MPQYKLRMWDGQQEHFEDVSTVLLATADVVDYRAGDDPSTSPHKITGRVKYEDITLEWGLTQDSGFANWAAKVTASASSSGAEHPRAISAKASAWSFTTRPDSWWSATESPVGG